MGTVIPKTYVINMLLLSGHVWYEGNLVIWTRDLVSVGIAARSRGLKDLGDIADVFVLLSNYCLIYNYIVTQFLLKNWNILGR